jgi:hypothetical protein
MNENNLPITIGGNYLNRDGLIDKNDFDRFLDFLGLYLEITFENIIELFRNFSF